jgi:hypothetical protein
MKISASRGGMCSLEEFTDASNEPNASIITVPFDMQTDVPTVTHW